MSVFEALFFFIYFFKISAKFHICRVVLMTTSFDTTHSEELMYDSCGSRSPLEFM